MTVEEKAYNYASKVAKNRLTASEIAAHYGRGYIEGQEDMKRLAPFVCVSNKTWRPASELPNMGEEVVTWVNHEDGAITVSRGVYVGWPEEIINKLRWCYPPKED